jgi:hypothetical protein
MKMPRLRVRTRLFALNGRAKPSTKIYSGRFQVRLTRSSYTGAILLLDGTERTVATVERKDAAPTCHTPETATVSGPSFLDYSFLLPFPTGGGSPAPPVFFNAAHPFSSRRRHYGAEVVARNMRRIQTSTGARINGGLYLTPWRRSLPSTPLFPFPLRRSPPAAFSCPSVADNKRCNAAIQPNDRIAALRRLWKDSQKGSGVALAVRWPFSRAVPGRGVWGGHIRLIG